MGFSIGLETVRTFDWKDLHKKILRIGVAEANIEAGEPLTQVYGMDLEDGTIYVLHEFRPSESGEEK